MNNEEPCPFCGGTSRLETEAVKGRKAEQKRRCLKCGAAFLVQVERPKAKGCGVACPEHLRCLDADNPQRCALWRMMQRNPRIKR